MIIKRYIRSDMCPMIGAPIYYDYNLRMIGRIVYSTIVSESISPNMYLILIRVMDNYEINVLDNFVILTSVDIACNPYALFESEYLDEIANMLS